jgi:hypothetical protein
LIVLTVTNPGNVLHINGANRYNEARHVLSIAAHQGTALYCFSTGSHGKTRQSVAMPKRKKSPVGFSYVTDGRFSVLKGKYADAFGVFAIRSATVQIRYQNRYITIALCI